MGLHWIDWLVLIGTISFIIIYGIIKSKKASQGASEFLKGTEHVKWYAIGLSVMATQASAITFMSTPGQAFHDGMGFVQFYFGLPIEMEIICIKFIPIFHRLNVYTAYEYLENRFDNKTRILTSLLFLIQRGLGTGITIYAPSIILSTILGWDLTSLNYITGGLVILYTISGGTKAVAITQNQQMAIMIGGMIMAFCVTLHLLPENIGLSEAMTVAGFDNKMNILDFSFDPENRYTFWSGITGGMFLALAYFGTDQSQVQRYISGNNIRESRLGLIFNGLLKVPMQFFILMCGVMVFVFYQYQKAPVFFNQHVLTKLKSGEHKEKVIELESKYNEVFDARKLLISDTEKSHLQIDKIQLLNAEEKKIRTEIKTLVKNSNYEDNDKDYVFISFVLKYLPIGVIGLLLAVVFNAAMSASSSGISALATCTTIDIYKRNFARDKSDSHYLKAGKIFTLMWGIASIQFANMSSMFENLIQFVNIIGSIFYGTILGIFLSGFYIKRIKGNHVFIAAIITEIMVIALYKSYEIGYL
ncbi:MAG: hypothetical protein RLZZ546_2492, partial [Bacteroidota bacterium]